MATPEQEAEALVRQKRTRLLLAGGAASLLLPLLGALYLRWSEAKTAKGPSGRADMFERREGQKLVPSQSVVPPATLGAAAGLPAGGSGGSLGMIQAVDELRPKPPPPPPPAPAPAYVPPPPPPMPEPKPAPRAVVMPKLKPSSGFSNFKSGIGSPSAMPGSAGAGGSAATPGMGGNAAQMMQDPQVQQYLKNQGLQGP